MSFIGPRPDTPMYLDKYTEEERIVLTVRPGKELLRKFVG